MFTNSFIQVITVVWLVELLIHTPDVLYSIDQMLVIDVWVLLFYSSKFLELSAIPAYTSNGLSSSLAFMMFAKSFCFFLLMLAAFLSALLSS